MTKRKSSDLKIHKPITGSGFGGGSSTEVQQRTPVDAPDTLTSQQFAHLVDLISEGPIGGLCYPNGQLIPAAHAEWAPSAVYYDGVQVLNSDGSLNIQGVKVGAVYGEQVQRLTPGFDQALDIIPAGERIRFGFPISKSINDSDAHAIGVAIKVPALVNRNETTGDTAGGSVSFSITIILHAGGDHAYYQGIFTIEGKATNPYVWDRLFVLPRSSPDSTTDTWTVRVTRETVDSTSNNRADETNLEHITIVNASTYSYPNSACILQQIDAKGFSSIPSRGFHVRLLKVKVPSNYFPEPVAYNRSPITGLPLFLSDGTTPDLQPWDGSFYLAWTDNPAWCFYDLVTNPRYGLGDYLKEVMIDKWSLYEIAKFCDELVDDGRGGREKRFTCNVYIQTAEEAYKVISDMASIFRGIVYWANGALYPVQDRPKAARAVFTNANVLEGRFTYSGTSKKARHTIAFVRYNDPEQLYTAVYEYVEDPQGVLDYGYRETTVAAFGCTSRAQAHRLGKWTLLSEQRETTTLVFEAGLEGAILRPGDIIEILDTNRSGTKNGGRVSAISEDRRTVTLDRVVELVYGTNVCKFAIPKRDYITEELSQSGIEQRPPHVAEHTTNNTVPENGTLSTNVLTFASAVDELILPGTIWVLQGPVVVPQEFRVLDIKETDHHSLEITGLEYSRNKFAASESNLVLPDPIVSQLSPRGVMPPAVSNVVITRLATYTPNGGIVLKLLLVWDCAPNNYSDGFLVEHRRNTDNWTTGGFSATKTYEFVYQLPGVYEFRITNKGKFGVNSEPVLATFTVPNASPIELYTLSGLEIVGNGSMGQGNDTNFIGRDVNFQWRLNTPAAGSLFGETDYGIGANGADPYFLDYEVTIWDINSNQQVYREVTTAPNFAYTYDKNRQSVGAPPIGRNQFKIQVRGRSKWNDLTVPISLTVQNAAPNPPTDAQIFASFRAVWISWTNSAEPDLDGVNIYEGTGPLFANATLIGRAYGSNFFRGSLDSGTHYYYWLKSVDTFGSLSALAPNDGPLNTTLGSIANTDIADFSVKATNLFTNTIVLDGDVWTDNSPTTGKIAWNAHTLVYQGAKYAIAAGNTDKKFIYWKNSELTYRSSDTHPSALMTPITDGDFIIATNIAGLHDLAWNAVANEVIGSAYIQNLAVKNAHIADVSADKIQAGTISGQTILLADDGIDPDTGVIRSANYSPGTVGWKIAANGQAEFNSVTIRTSLSEGAAIANSAYPTKLAFPYPTLRIEERAFVSEIRTDGFTIQIAETGGGYTGITKKLLGERNLVLTTAPNPVFAGVNVASVLYDTDKWTLGVPVTSGGNTLLGCRLTRNGLNRIRLRVRYQFLTVTYGDDPNRLIAVNMDLFYALFDPPTLGSPILTTDGMTLHRLGRVIPKIRPNASPTVWDWAFFEEVVDINVPANKVLAFFANPFHPIGVTADNINNIYHWTLEATALNFGNYTAPEDRGNVVD